MPDTEKTWERWPDETERNYARFLLYRNSPAPRSIIDLMPSLGIGEQMLYKITREFKWRDRADAYDVWVMEQASQNIENAVVTRSYRAITNIDYQEKIEADASFDGAIWLDVWRKQMAQYQAVQAKTEQTDGETKVSLDAKTLLDMAKARVVIDDMLRRSAGLPLAIKTKEVEDKPKDDQVFYITDE